MPITIENQCAQPEDINPTPRSKELRELFIQVLQENSPCDAILLSGGLDTSVIAEACSDQPNILNISTGITVCCGETASDRPFSTEIARKLGVQHKLIEFDSPLELIRDQELLDFSVKTLKTFDPMELRNSIVIAKSMLLAKELGVKSLAAGDGADEIFAGYSFMHGMPEEKLLLYIKHMTETMTFCAKKFGDVLGIRIIQPYLDLRVIKFAKSCTSRGELIQSVNIPDGDTGNTKQALHGKMVLRLAFPEATSCWRKKDPIEQGSGTTILPQLLQAEADKSFETTQQDILEKYSIKIRDPEHLYYFKAFQRVFGHNLDNGLERNGSDPCIGCRFQLPDDKAMFCKVCGAWPARETDTN
ncbi:hypothetical protein K450DRAFT_277224 [Umbelopsis ramanniana AG]|uniref:Asparagine synthetase domain-containing protein n=1 Tax=Umbelopsis ramanniana AG TaxID=1314678 RepID=A0AAD5EIH3_UMBRA|nr:uncharacterized protein K450DRAFT_277224 [Umbelopsis ramanniana AG]KAI8583655.1 hypothetical protein K450DRAFT_277224 [Umbelopsis ramanniana AG]